MIQLNLMCPCEICPSVFKQGLELLGCSTAREKIIKFYTKYLMSEL